MDSEEAPTRGALVNLIARVRESSGLSYRALADRAITADPTVDLSYQQLQSYGKGTARKAPSRRQIHALSLALRVDEADVMRAVFEQFYGYIPAVLLDVADGDGSHAQTTALIPPDLSNEERLRLEAIIRAFVDTVHPGT